jgi:tRNA (guanine37-N1)-methyltransferase
MTKKRARPEHNLSSYDIIGDIAVLEIPRPSKSIISRVVRRIRDTHPRIKTILVKSGERKGEFRLRRMKRVFGRETETIHKEHGFRFRLDPTKVYFSPRESTERERIASMVKPGETVMVMFAGAGPYGILIAGKQHKVGRVYQVEINPWGFDYMKQSIAMNKLSHLVIPIMGDVRKVCKKFEGSCDRVVMPLPREGYRFLDVALKCLKRKGFIHFYSIGKARKGSKATKAEKEIFEKSIERLEHAAKRLGKKIKILAKRKVLPYGPGSWKICIDAEVKVFVKTAARRN